jgi:flagellar assembly protein FliH
MKNNPENKPKAMKLYFFPEIACKEITNPREVLSNTSDFHPFRFEEGDSVVLGRPDPVIRNVTVKEVVIENAGETRRQAYREGFQEGEAAGIELEKKKMEPVLNGLRQALATLADIKKELYRNAEKNLVDLSLAIARKIVGYEMNTNNKTVAHVVREALKKTDHQEKVKVRLSPVDLKLLTEENSGFARLSDDAHNVTLEPDETILSGGCVIETDLGDIDARTEKQFQVVKEAFEEALQKSSVQK